MADDLLKTQQRRKLVLGVLAVAIIASALLAIALFYMSKSRPHF
jgi:hypothetical protein